MQRLLPFIIIYVKTFSFLPLFSEKKVLENPIDFVVQIFRLYFIIMTIYFFYIILNRLAVYIDDVFDFKSREI